jgi:hypothetical protein
LLALAVIDAGQLERGIVAAGDFGDVAGDELRLDREAVVAAGDERLLLAPGARRAAVLVAVIVVVPTANAADEIDALPPIMDICVSEKWIVVVAARGIVAPRVEAAIRESRAVIVAVVVVAVVRPDPEVDEQVAGGNGTPRAINPIRTRIDRLREIDRCEHRPAIGEAVVPKAGQIDAAGGRPGPAGGNPNPVRLIG